MHKMLTIFFISFCFSQTSIANLVIGILDDYDNTDILVYIDRNAKKIIWIPRDIFS
jgi:hypothetical protein